MLQDAANRRDGTVSTMETIGVEDADNMFEGFVGRINPRQYVLDGDRALPTRHPALPPSALGPRKFHFLENADVSMEAVTHQMAGVLRAVEEKVKKIEVRDDFPSRYVFGPLTTVLDVHTSPECSSHTSENSQV